MALNPIEISGAVNRADDIYHMRNQSDNKMYVDNSAAFKEVEKKSKDINEKVVKSDNSDFFNKKFDAKEKGSNSYQDNRNRNSKDKNIDGVVVVKKSSGFDISI